MNRFRLTELSKTGFDKDSGLRVNDGDVPPTNSGGGISSAPSLFVGAATTGVIDGSDVYPVPSPVTSDELFMWDIAGLGWDQGSWGPPQDWLGMYLTGDLSLYRGYGSVAYTRTGTVTRTNSSGGTDTLAANVPPFDWIAGPSGSNRYCYRADSSVARCLVPLSGNFLCEEGAIAIWVRYPVIGTDTTGYTILQAGNWYLGVPAGSTLLTWQVPFWDGTNVQLTYDVSVGPWAANSWHLIVAGWSVSASKIYLSIDGATLSNATMNKIPAQEGANLSLGHDQGGGHPFTGYFGGFRLWPTKPTDGLASNLFMIKS